MISLLFYSCFWLLGLSPPDGSAADPVNFAHLRHLTETIPFSGDTVDIVHIYANYPAYEWVSAAESGPEGIACVDDAARAAVLYLRYYELREDPASLPHARALLKFVLKMQADNGEFYNFIFQDRSINRVGKTSYKSFGWWASRALWSMALGARVLRRPDPAFAETLRTAVRKSFPHVARLLKEYNGTRDIGGYEVSRWLLYESGADATSELLLGLNEYLSVERDPSLNAVVRNLAEGLMTMQDGNVKTFPYGLHRSWETTWHMWGNAQTQALATVGRKLGEPSMIASAEREAIGWYTRLIIEGFLKEMDVRTPGKKVAFEQIAYGVRPMAVGLVRLHEATGKPEYLAMAGLAVSWLFGNNALNQPMYDSFTGRCLDGIRDSMSVNKNSGAESTIEALLAILEVGEYPQAKKYFHYRKTKQGTTARYLYGVFSGEQGEELTLALDLKEGSVVLMEGRDSKAFLQQLH